jgi:hypothetical protein
MGIPDKRESQYNRSLIEARLDPLFTISPEGIITEINNASIDIKRSNTRESNRHGFFRIFYRT